MPELPEVEVVRFGLEPAVVRAHVLEVDVFEPRSLRRHTLHVEDFRQRLQGATILAAVRRGKFLWFPLASDHAPEGTDQALIVHLGMSGQLLLRDLHAPVDPLTRIRLVIRHPVQGDFAIHFVDQRIFGSLAIDDLVSLNLPGGFAGKGISLDNSVLHAIPSQVQHIARDPLDPLFDGEEFAIRLSRKRTEIKRALLDQELISGIGNIYADEALWLARMHYGRAASSLSSDEVSDLLNQIRTVLKKALIEGGTSFDAQYVNVNGESGYFAHSLNAYGQQGKPCARCGTTVVRERFMNRGSHFCPSCQR